MLFNTSAEELFLVVSYLRSKIAAARLQLQAVPIYFHFQAVKRAVLLCIAEREFKKVHIFWWFGEAPKSCIEIVAVVKERAAGPIREFRQGILRHGHCAAHGSYNLPESFARLVRGCVRWR